MTAWPALLRPAALGLKNTALSPGRGGRARAAAVGLFTLVVGLLIFLFAARVLGQLKAADVVGLVLCRKFLGLIWIAGTMLLMFSALISSLSSFFLARDLELLAAAPVSRESLFWARSTEALLASAWMPAAFLLPLFLAYGWVFRAGPGYFLAAPLAALPLLAGAGYLSQMLAMVLVNVFPARRAREIMGLTAVAGFCGLYLAFRLMRPEELVNPAGFMTAAAYLASLEATSPAWPTEWAVSAVWPLLSGEPGFMPPARWLLMLWSTAAALGVMASYVAAALYWTGYNKTLAGAARRRGGAGSIFGRALDGPARLMKPARRALVVKDLKIFFRDHSQWSQLLLLAALLFIYLYNFSILNLGRFPAGAFVLENSFAFLNIALVALVAATLSLRFAFPSISAEGPAFWIVKAAPLSLKDFLLIKLWLWLPPIWLIAMGLIFFGNRWLDVGPVMNGAALGLTALLTPGLCALAVGLGARYPRFDAANPAEAPTGYGGLVYMVSSSLAAITVIGLSAWPIIHFLRLDRGRPLRSGYATALSVGLLALAAAICLWLWFGPLKRGLIALQEGHDEG